MTTNPFGGTIRYERDPAVGAARLVCPGPSGSEGIVLELPDSLRLPGKAPEHR